MHNQYGKIGQGSGFRIALVHDWLDTLGGAERVLIEFHRMFPQAPIYTLFARPEFVKEHLPDATIITSWLQDMPFPRSPYWAPLMTSIIEGFDLSSFDMVLSSSVFFSKGLVLRPRTMHICYCYSPTREIWDRSTNSRTGFLASVGKHVLRIWDRTASDRVDQFVAISQHVQQRIKKYYRRDAQVIYPPLTLATVLPRFRTQQYTMVTRLYPHKNIEIAIEAFNKLGYTLNIIGEGPLAKSLQKIAGPTIRFFGYQSDKLVAEHIARARAFIMPQEEDFGLTPVEALAHGTPVVALRRGGALEIIQEGKTGEFFDDPIPEALADGVRRLNEHYATYDHEYIISSAERFSRERFHDQLLTLIHETRSRYH